MLGDSVYSGRREVSPWQVVHVKEIVHYQLHKSVDWLVCYLNTCCVRYCRT